MAFRRLGPGRVLLTGGTGLVGQAVLQRLLADYPQVDVVLLVRRSRHEPASRRVARLLSKPCFSSWREEVGAAAAERAIRDRIEVIEADLGQSVPTVPAGLDVVIHCAGDVAFDKPVDESLRTNLLGTRNMLDAILASADCPHFVHVSTAYVAGFRKGLRQEAPIEHAADWRQELAVALAARQAAELSSRGPSQQAHFLRQARRHDQIAGAQAVASRAEELRRDWVTDHLVTFGRARARTLGWPDCYTFSKALAERALEETASGDKSLPLSIVRPSIIESALKRPYPGWSEGFKVSGPLIVAFGQGVVTDLPVWPDAVMDLIPVDLVASAILAVAGNPPEPGRPAYYHVASGARNPLTCGELLGHVTGYFEANPLADVRGTGLVAVPPARFVPTARREQSLRIAERLVAGLQQALMVAAPGERGRTWIDAVARQDDRLRILRRFVDLYGPYLEVEATFCDRGTAALHASMPERDRAAAGFDVTDIDWACYLRQVHFPSVTAPLRDLGPVAARRKRRPFELPEAADIVAAFDLEGTLLASNVIEAYLWTRLLGRPPAAWGAELTSVLGAAPRYLALDHRSRAEFLREFARKYRGTSERELRRLVSERAGNIMLERAWPTAIRRVRKHRAAGHRTLLVTGAIDVFIEPFAPLFDEMIATRLEVVDGRVTGFLAGPPLVGEARAAWLRQWSAQHNIDLSRSYAYADHYSDRAFLEAVGNPVVVNPDPRLYQHARRAHWPVERWRDYAQSAFDALALAAGSRQAARWGPR